MKALKLAAATFAIVAFAVANASSASETKKTVVAAKDKCALTMEAKVGEGDATFSITPARENATYNWTVSAGTILSGQGTDTVTVSLAGMAKGDTVTATAEVDGLDVSCKGKATLSATTELP